MPQKDVDFRDSKFGDVFQTILGLNYVQLVFSNFLIQVFYILLNFFDILVDFTFGPFLEEID